MLRHDPVKVGDSVIVKSHVRCPEFGTDLASWQGRITEVDEKERLVCIDWDSQTLRETAGDLIDRCESEGLDWYQMYLKTTEVELTTPRDTEEDVIRMIQKLQKEHGWSHLSKEGQRIQTVLKGVNPEDDWACMKAWGEHLRLVLDFPFEAQISEFQEQGPLRAGYKVSVKSIVDVHDLYGVLVEVKYERETYSFPLCDLKATNRKSPHYQFVQDYAVWFANR